MSKINVLSPEIYNKISAGEVVENPVGAVKELVENSIDSGANYITIEIENGGFGLISVKDNGCGISEDDIDKAFLKHATSKLKEIGDLYCVYTLGFRGEALSSIAAVSNITLTTRTEQNDVAVKVDVIEGVVKEKSYVSANTGTRIEVRDLFFNTPARKKFFKSETKEATEITKFVAKLILTNPDIAIDYILNGKKVYSAPGRGIESAIFAVYGGEGLDTCLKVDRRVGENAVKGYICMPEACKANRNYQTISVNGRCISDIGLQGVISQAYKPYLMAHKFPLLVLNISAPADQVDVNVHPKKTEVRFANQGRLYSLIYHVIQDRLKDYSEHKIDEMLRTSTDVGDATPVDAEKDTSNDEAEPKKEYAWSNFDAVKHNYGEQQSIFGAEDKKVIDSLKPDFDDYENVVRRFNFDGRLLEIRDLEAKPKNIDDLPVDYHTIEPVSPRKLSDNILTDEIIERLNKELTVENARKMIEKARKENLSQTRLTLEPSKADVPELTPEEKFDNDMMLRAQVIGVAFKTYLIVEIDDKILLIDQHAAHERYLFDRFMAGKRGNYQPVMFPYAFTVSEEEANFIEENLENIKKAGVVIENFGTNTYRIVSVCTLLTDLQMNEFVEFLLSSIDDYKLDTQAMFVEKLAKMACKAAIKAGYTMNNYELKSVLRMVLQDKIVQCPHGRPITFVYTKKQIEKMFKRIV